MDPKTFNVLEAIEGRTFPEDTVTLYMDAGAGYALQAFRQAHADTPAEPKAIKAADKRLKELEDAVKASALTFHLRGLSTDVDMSIDEEARAKFQLGEDVEDLDEVPDAGRYRTERLIAESIVKVVDANGAEDVHHWKQDEVAVLRGRLPQTEYSKLILKTVELTYNNMLFTGMVGPDFS